MNFVNSAGELSRLIGFEPAEWRARVRTLLGRRRDLGSSTKVDAGRIADAWIAEYGDAAAWNATRKIGELVEWDDHEGARHWIEILNIIQERRRAHEPSAT